MVENFEVNWSAKFVTGNKEIDTYHKEIIDGVIELYKMLDDSSKYMEEIPKLTKKLEESMYKHLDIEINYLKRFDLPDWKAHETSHNRYKKEYEFYQSYAMPVVIRAVLTGEIVRNYMINHFPHFDANDIPLIREKLKEEGEEEY